MSIITEINRLSQAKSNLKTTIENKGIIIPSDVKIDEYYKYIDLKYLLLTFEILSSGDIYFSCDDSSKTIQYSKNGGEWTNLTSTNNYTYTQSLTVEGKSGTYTYGGFDDQMGMFYWINGNDRVYFWKPEIYYDEYIYDSSWNEYSVLTIQNTVMPHTTSITVEGKSGTYTYGGYDDQNMGMYYWENSNDRVYNYYYYVTTNDNVYDSSWNEYSVLTTQNEVIGGISVVNGDIVQFKGNNTTYDSNTFENTTCRFNVYGNIMSLINSTNFSNLTTLTDNYTFLNLFQNCNVISSSNLILPATTLADSCYSSMFNGCTSLTTTVSELPATALVDRCYSSMFQGCSSLTTAPELPATILSSAWCYGSMFYGCSSLNYIKCLAITRFGNGCTSNWVNGVSASGTFVKNVNASWSTGTSDIPSGWTVTNNT